MMNFFETRGGERRLTAEDFEAMRAEDARAAARAFFLMFCSRLGGLEEGDDPRVFTADELEQIEDRAFVLSWSKQVDELGTYLRFTSERAET